ncbi:MAG: ATP-binding protein [Patescibacteria group bacterium]
MPALAELTKNGRTTPEALIEILKEKKEPSLGELNPLLFPPDLTNPEAIDALKLVALKKITKYGGLEPTVIESAAAYNIHTHKQEPRLIVRFNVDTLTQEQLAALENLVRSTYSTAVKTRKSTYGTPITIGGYPELDNPQERRRQKSWGKRLGWYFGPNLDPKVENTHTGLFVHKDLGTQDMANFLKGRDCKEWFFNANIVDPIIHKPVKTSYIIEIREADLYHTDVIEFTTQVAHILAKGHTITDRWLKYEIYNDLNRLGLRKNGKDTAHGLDKHTTHIERVLILPLANLGLSTSIRFNAGSVLLVGVPGTGKTLVAEQFLQRDIGVFLLPIDPLHLAQELYAPPEKKRILPRISQVFAQTGIPVVLHIDDIENVLQGKEQNTINSTLLNLMAGVRESGFFVLASTNHPEQLNDQLLQPQRFAHILYFGLCNEEARRGILEVHTTQISRSLNIPLFNSVQERATVIRAIALHTQGYTPRYLAEICTTAKSFYLARIAVEKNRRIGLSEEDINTTFTLEDWARALDEVDKKYNKLAVSKRDEELRRFVEKHHGQVGFGIPSQNGKTVALQETVARLNSTPSH